MATSREDSRILTQFMPSLAHLAVVKIVDSFFQDLLNDLQTLERAYEDIQHGISANFDDQKAKRAEKKLLLIPVHLRHTVVQTIFGIRWKFFTLLNDILKIFKFNEINFKRSCNLSFYFKLERLLKINETVQMSDGPKMNLKVKFTIACIYCLEKSVLSLWEELVASGETNYFEVGNHVMVDFWVRWIQEGSRVPWLQAIKESLTFSQEISDDLFLIGPFFHFLRSEEREKFLPYLTCTTLDDLQICLRAATKDEEVKVLEADVYNILRLYLQWPLQNLFLEIAGKVWHFIDVDSFIDILLCIWEYQEIRKDYDYCQIFVDFFNMSPNCLRESVKEYPKESRKICSILNKIKRKRSISGTDQSKWVRRNGRLKRVTQISNLV